MNIFQLPNTATALFFECIAAGFVGNATSSGFRRFVKQRCGVDCYEWLSEEQKLSIEYELESFLQASVM